MTNPLDRKYLLRLRILGYVEGVSTLLLFGVAMPLKYAADMPEAVTIVGMVHGILFMALVAMFVFAVDRVPIPMRPTYCVSLMLLSPTATSSRGTRLRICECTLCSRP